MKRILWALCAATLVSSAVSAADKAATPEKALATSRKTPPLPAGDRFLFVVDTSAGMARLGNASRQAVFDLIESGLNGHMRPGDTYGLWTFNSEPQTGVFPMQVWNTNTLELASRAEVFLRDQPYEKRARLAPTVARLNSIIALVQDVTIFIVTDGTTPIKGTPFDEGINAAFKQRLPEVRQVKKPLVTTLIARGGALVHWSVTLAGESFLLLDRTSPPAMARAPDSAPTNAPPVRVLPSTPRAPIIIQRARPPDSVAPAKPPNAQIEPPVPPPPTDPVVEPALTNLQSAAPAPAARQETNPASLLAPDSKPVAVVETDTNPPVFSVAATVRSQANNPPPQLLAPGAGNPARDLTVAATTNGNTNPVAALDLPPAAQTSAPPSPALSRPSLLSPVAVAARESLSVEKQTNDASGSALAVAGPAAAPRTLRPLPMLAFGVILLLGAFMLIILFVKRSRSAPKPSVISQSMDRGHPPQPGSV
jgi:hypothetical protein